MVGLQILYSGLRWPLLEQQLRIGLGVERVCQGHIVVALREAVWHLEVEVQQQARENELDLVGGEEAARAHMSAKSERQVLLGCADELVLLLALVVEDVG